MLPALISEMGDQKIAPRVPGYPQSLYTYSTGGTELPRRQLPASSRTQQITEPQGSPLMSIVNCNCDSSHLHRDPQGLLTSCCLCWLTSAMTSLSCRKRCSGTGLTLQQRSSLYLRNFPATQRAWTLALEMTIPGEPMKQETFTHSTSHIFPPMEESNEGKNHWRSKDIFIFFTLVLLSPYSSSKRYFQSAPLDLLETRGKKRWIHILVSQSIWWSALVLFFETSETVGFS